MFDPVVILRIGQIFLFEERVFKISCLQREDDGTPMITAQCLTPTKEDEGRVWWSILVNDPEGLELYTVH